MSEIAFYYPDGHKKHFKAGHPERPERVEIIRKTLRASGIWDRSPKLFPIEYKRAMEAILSVHSSDYVETIKATCALGGNLDADTYTTKDSWEIAVHTAGGAIQMALSVWSGRTQTGLALTRPPGHHAEMNKGMGFCLLNNIAIAAEYLLHNEFIENPGRLAIIDLDLHHGNGTQDIFWERNDVFYVSVHQSPLYPGTGKVDDIGSEKGKGFTLNIPFPPGTGDNGYIATMDEIVLPMLDRYLPEMILVSYGFDPHWLDPLGHIQLSALGYYEIIKKLRDWAKQNCNGKIALFLEGGYDLDAASACSSGVVAALTNAPFNDPIGPSKRKEGSSWKSVISTVKELWQL